MKIFLLIAAAHSLSIIGDVLLRVGSTQSQKWPWILGCTILYASTAPIWFMIYKNVRTFSSLLYYFPVWSCIYILAGIFVLNERQLGREWMAIVIGVIAKFVGGG